MAVAFVIESSPSRPRTEMLKTFVAASHLAWCVVTRVHPAPAVSVEVGLVTVNTPPATLTVIWSL